jgi:hypothetical protein
LRQLTQVKDVLDQFTHYTGCGCGSLETITYANSQNPTADRHFHYDSAYNNLTDIWLDARAFSVRVYNLSGRGEFIRPGCGIEGE